MLQVYSLFHVCTNLFPELEELYQELIPDQEKYWFGKDQINEFNPVSDPILCFDPVQDSYLWLDPDSELNLKGRLWLFLMSFP